MTSVKFEDATEGKADKELGDEESSPSVTTSVIEELTTSQLMDDEKWAIVDDGSDSDGIAVITSEGSSDTGDGVPDESPPPYSAVGSAKLPQEDRFTDLSSPVMSDQPLEDLGVVSYERKYPLHKRNMGVNKTLNFIVFLTVAIVFGIAVGHYSGFSDQEEVIMDLKNNVAVLKEALRQSREALQRCERARDDSGGLIKELEEGKRFYKMGIDDLFVQKGECDEELECLRQAHKERKSAEETSLRCYNVKLRAESRPRPEPEDTPHPDKNFDILSTMVKLLEYQKNLTEHYKSLCGAGDAATGDTLLEQVLNTSRHFLQTLTEGAADVVKEVRSEEILKRMSRKRADISKSVLDTIGRARTALQRSFKSTLKIGNRIMEKLRTGDPLNPSEAEGGKEHVVGKRETSFEDKCTSQYSKSSKNCPPEADGGVDSGRRNSREADKRPGPNKESRSDEEWYARMGRAREKRRKEDTYEEWHDHVRKSREGLVLDEDEETDWYIKKIKERGSPWADGGRAGVPPPKARHGVEPHSKQSRRSRDKPLHFRRK